MNVAHLHLVLNHLPMIGTVFGVVLFSIALMRRREELKNTSLGIFVVVAVVALPVYFTGEPAEDVVEHLPGVSASILERHEEAAEIAFVAVELLGAISLAGLVLFRSANGIPKWFAALSLVLSVMVGGWWPEESPTSAVASYVYRFSFRRKWFIAALKRGRHPEVGVWLAGAMPFRAETSRGYVDGYSGVDPPDFQHWRIYRVD